MADLRATFSGTIPEYYDKCLGPAWLDAYAVDLARRLPSKPPGDVLEIACGTGLVTQRLRERLDSTIRLVATDLSNAMLDYARDKLSERTDVAWREADAVELPFGDSEFGSVVCAFGFMFVPDKRAAFREAYRVLKEGGILLFNVWDRIEENPHAAINAQVLEEVFPGDEKMRFRIPHEMHSPSLLDQLVTQAGFREVQIEMTRIPVDRVSARTIAIGQCRGTPRYSLIEERGGSVDKVIDKVTDALARTGGADPYRGVAQALVVQARR